MEPCVSLHKRKSTKPYPIRILKIDNICIDEEHNLSSPPPEPEPAAETHTLSESEKTDLNTLFESYRAFIVAKKTYEAAAETFWKSHTGVQLDTILNPDPLVFDRVALQEKKRILESRLASLSIQIKNSQIDISGYNYIVAKFTLLMYETQHIPRIYNDFVLDSIHERILDEIPKLWTNKMIIQRKKLVECVYVYGHVLPPYRLKDMQ